MRKTVLYTLSSCVLLSICLSFDTARAQTAASSKDVFSKLPREVYDSLHQERMARALKKRMYEDSVMRAYYRVLLFFPPSVEAALGEQRSKDAEREYKHFKDTLHLGSLDRFYLDYLDYDFQARMADYGACDLNTHIKYLKKREKTAGQLIKRYPRQPRAILLELYGGSEKPSFEKLLDVYNRMIAADSTFLPTYEQRGDLLWQSGYTEEACRDYYRLPDVVQNNIGLGARIEECDKFFEAKKRAEEAANSTEQSANRPEQSASRPEQSASNPEENASREGGENSPEKAANSTEQSPKIHRE